MGSLFDDLLGGGMPPPPPDQGAWTPPDIAPGSGGMPTQGQPQDQTVKIQIEGPDMQPGQLPPPTGQQPPQAAPPQPYPQPPTQQPTGPNDPFQNAPPGPVAPATPAGPWQGNPNAPTSGPNIRPPTVDKARDPKLWTPEEKAAYGGQDMFGDPSMGDYDSVQNYADQAYEQSQRYMAPQHAQQDRRMQQELINKGIDPSSPQGQEMQNMMAMQQSDQQNAAQFGALQFGQGIQNQMFGQEQQQANRAAQMQQALWGNQLGASGQNLQKYLGDQNANMAKAQMAMQGQMANAQNALGWGQLNQQGQNNQNQYNLSKAGQDLQRYGMDQGYQLGQGNLDLGRQQQNFNELLGLEGINFRDKQFNQGQQNWQDDFLYNMMNGTQGFGGQGPSGGGQFTSGPSNVGGEILGGIGSFFSDRRLKRNIKPVGEISGVNLYSYNYIWDDIERIGPMADEVPHAVIGTVGGFAKVDPRRVL